MSPAVDIAVTVECPAWAEALPDAEDRCRRLAAIALGAVEMPKRPVELSIVLADDATVRHGVAAYASRQHERRAASRLSVSQVGRPQHRPR